MPGQPSGAPGNFDLGIWGVMGGEPPKQEKFQFFSENVRHIFMNFKNNLIGKEALMRDPTKNFHITHWKFLKNASDFHLFCFFLMIIKEI